MSEKLLFGEKAADSRFNLYWNWLQRWGSQAYYSSNPISSFQICMINELDEKFRNRNVFGMMPCVKCHYMIYFAVQRKKNTLYKKIKYFYFQAFIFWVSKMLSWLTIFEWGLWVLKPFVGLSTDLTHLTVNLFVNLFWVFDGRSN